MESKKVAPEDRINEHLINLAKHYAIEAVILVEKVLSDQEGSKPWRKETRTNLAVELVKMFMHVGKMGAVNAVIDPYIRQRIERASPYRAGKRSGEIRAARGHKARAISWAIEARKSNPTLSKNELARLYTLTQPGTSVSTIRRYLADIKN